MTDNKVKRNMKSSIMRLLSTLVIAASCLSAHGQQRHVDTTDWWTIYQSIKAARSRSSSVNHNLTKSQSQNQTRQKVEESPRKNPEASKNDMIVYSLTTYPNVADQYESDYGNSRITRVGLTNKFTLVELEDVVPSNVSNTWISLSSKTILVNKYSKTVLTVLDWGYKDADSGEYKSMDFNSKYTLEAGGRYNLYMAFPPVDAATDNISIYENGNREGFYWQGIQLSEFGRQ